MHVYLFHSNFDSAIASILLCVPSSNGNRQSNNESTMANRLLKCSVALLLVLMLAIVFFPFLEILLPPPPEIHQRKVTVVRMKKIALALQQYAMDNRGFMPTNFYTENDIIASVSGRINSNDIHTMNPQGGSFVPNTKLAGTYAVNLPNDDETILFFESKDWPDQRRCYAFLSGRIRILDKLNARKYISN